MDNKILLAIVLGVLLLCSAFALGIALNKPVQVKEVPTTQTIVVEKAYNDTGIVTQIASVQATLDKDDIWKAEAIKLAEADWNNKKDLYKALLSLNVTDLDDKDDINRVVIKDTDVSGIDTDDKDADVTQEVRVYYENSNGNDLRVTLEIETEILENDVEGVDFALA
jgi:hypothetical protein